MKKQQKVIQKSATPMAMANKKRNESIDPAISFSQHTLAGADTQWACASPMVPIASFTPISTADCRVHTPSRGILFGCFIPTFRQDLDIF